MGKRTPFGDVLRRLRLRCGLTQQAVAKTLPNFQQLGRIAKVFGVSRETLSAYLEHPEQSAGWRLPQRAPKRAAENPGSLGKLQPDEKSLIALYRLCDAQGRKTLVEAAREQSSRSNQKK